MPAITVASDITGGVPVPMIMTEPYFKDEKVMASILDVGILRILSNYNII